MRTALLLAAAAAALSGCGSQPPAPDWQLNAHDALQRSVSAYLAGNSRVESAESRRAREQIASTGKVGLAIKAELIRCASHVAALAFDDCPGYQELRQDATAADQAYADYLAGRAGAALAALLPAQHQAVAAAANDTAAQAAMQAIADPMARLVAAGVLLRAGKATPAVLAAAADTASDQGWRRALLAWLGVQQMRARQAGDTAEAERIERRIALAAGTAGPKE
ncbi:hypothetical protein ACLB1G_18415 [Oxalobacteraceae bacterium A2-2]